MLHLSPSLSPSLSFLFHVVTGTTMYILSARPLMLLHSPSRLKPEEKREGEKKKTQERFCGVLFLSLFPSLSPSLSLSLARHLTSPGKRQIRFRLLSRQSKLRKCFLSLSLSLPLSLPLSLAVFASFPWMQSCEGRLHAFQTITVRPPPNCKFPLCQNPTHANTSFREP